MGSNLKINNRYIRTCRQYLRNQTVTAKNEMKNSVNFYRNNAKYSWQQGTRLAQIKKYDKFQTTVLKLYVSVIKTKIRASDLPAILGALGAVSPFPGGTIAGFISGKLLYNLIKKFK